ncbi:NACHT domain-containing protein [Streptomyces sp. NPDC006463]|uniref:NACHT domain-containing protein n=1 Tax=Streptomyces sp. NPDC006463 TaxID=3364746 RepID=UPI00367FDDA7
MAELPEQRRAGRPWGALRGASQELNEIAQALRAWLDDAGITVAALHARLTPDHFPDDIVPSQRKLYDFCAGKGLTWPFVEAVADVCTPTDASEQHQKLKQVRPLWDASCTAPTLVGPGQQLHEAKDRVIAAYEQIERLRQAQWDSEQTRVRNDRLVMMLLAMLGQLLTKIGDLTQERNRLLTERSPNPVALTVVETRLRETKSHREGTEEALRRAEQDRDEALQLADEARRLAGRLQDELDRVRSGGTEPTDPLAAQSVEPDGLDTASPAAPDTDEVFLNDYAEALRKAQAVLDTGSDALQAAEEQIAEVNASLPSNAWNNISGVVLSRTTADNPVPSTDAEFEELYRTYLTRRHGAVEIFGVDLGQSRHAHWSLDLSYVSLQVADAAQGVERVEQALAGRQRTVVMGTAGSGKTTLVQWLAVNAARGTLPDLLGHLNGSVPFVLPLRSLADLDSFPSPEELLAAVGCPLDGAQPRGWARRVFDHGRALVLVDGVDEISPEQRTRTRDWLQALLEEYPRGCYVVTTRPASVREDWLDDVGFRRLALLPMSADDVASSISLWHAAARSGANEEERQTLDVLEDLIQTTVRHNQNLAALATTPLLCSLLCVLNRDRRGLLPSSVMSLYGAALSMLLVRRDAERGIGAFEGIRINEHESVQLLQILAHWLTRNFRAETDTATAAQVLTRVLAAIPTVSAQGNAEQILRHLLIRSGVLREAAVGQLAFIHRSFQDYLAARAAVEAADFGVLVGMAHDESWENVVRMATGHARPSERATLLQGLVDRGDQEEDFREQLHQLAASCLEYATELSPGVREMVLRRAPERDL